MSAGLGAIGIDIFADEIKIGTKGPAVAEGHVSDVEEAGEGFAVNRIIKLADGKFGEIPIFVDGVESAVLVISHGGAEGTDKHVSPEQSRIILGQGRGIDLDRGDATHIIYLAGEGIEEFFEGHIIRIGPVHQDTGNRTIGDVVNLNWYLNRLKKMSFAEVLKRFGQHLDIYCSRIKYRDPSHWPYGRFARNDISLRLHSLPSAPVTSDWTHYRVYNLEFDLTKPIDWYFSEDGSVRWPACHDARINYRPGNPYGDVRINWELNRMQFLPVMAASDEDLAKSIIVDWLIKNPYLHGPGYLASMEVALRWISMSTLGAAP